MSKLEGRGGREGGREGEKEGGREGAVNIFVSKGIADANRIRKQGGRALFPLPALVIASPETGFSETKLRRNSVVRHTATNTQPTPSFDHSSVESMMVLGPLGLACMTENGRLTQLVRSIYPYLPSNRSKVA